MGVNRKVRNEVFARDRGKCTECGKTQAKAKAESRTGLQVHHIDLDPFNDDLANLRLLCVKCHGRVAAAARKQKLAESRYGRDLADRKKSGYERGLR